MFLQRFVLACASLATSASAYEVIQTPCKVGKREFHDASSCIAKATDLAEDGATFEVRLRADQPEAVESLVSALAEVDGMMIQKNDPLMAAFHQGSKQFWDELTESAAAGRLVGWEVGESIGSTVCMLAGGATLGSLGFAAGSTVGAAAGFAASSIALSHAPLLGIAVPQLAALITAVAVAQGTFGTVFPLVFNNSWQTSIQIETMGQSHVYSTAHVKKFTQGFHVRESKVLQEPVRCCPGRCCRNLRRS